MPSLPKTLPRWYSTVRGLRNSRVPISGLDRPARAMRTIWASRVVSRRLVVTVRLRAVSPVAARPFAVEQPGPREIGTHPRGAEQFDRLALHVTRADDWVEPAALNALSTSVILHVAIGRRWPFGRHEPSR